MKIGFIGAGNMANAIITGIKQSKISGLDIYTSKTSKDNIGVFKNAKDIVFICVKPQVFDSIYKELKKQISKSQLIVSIMAGKSIDYLTKTLGTKNIVRVMPNTPCLVGSGISAVAASDIVKKDKRYGEVLKIIESTGKAIEVDEKYINAITQVSGASPAFTFMYIEALADAGVKCGLPRKMALEFAKSAVEGAATLSIKSDKHVGELKDMVCSPAGTTIEGVKTLEEKGFRGAVIDAVCAAYDKCVKM